MDVDMLGLVDLGVGSRTVAPGVSGCYIALATLTWRTRLWFLVAVAWSHILCVVARDVGVLGLVLVWSG